MTEIKEFLVPIINACEPFQKYCDQETIDNLFSKKLQNMEDIEVYILNDQNIVSCMTAKEILLLSNC